MSTIYPFHVVPIFLWAFWLLKVGCGGDAFRLCAWGGIHGSHQLHKFSAGGMIQILMILFLSLEIFFSVFIDILKTLHFLHCLEFKFTTMCFTYIGLSFFVLCVPFSKQVLPISQEFAPFVANNWPVNYGLFTGVLYINQWQCFQGLQEHPVPLQLYDTFYSKVMDNSFYTGWMYLYT